MQLSARPGLVLGPVFVLFALVAGAALAAPTALEVTYLGNEGFLLSADGKKVLIDALHGDGLAGYVTLPTKHRTKLEAATPPFDGVTLVLATHAHADHFDPVSVGRYLEANPGAVFVSTQESRDVLEFYVETFDQMEGRIRPYLPEKGKRVAAEIAGIKLQLFRLPHLNVEHLGFIIELGGRKILHLGDTTAQGTEFRKLALADDAFDLALIPFWYFHYGHWKMAVEDHVSAAEAIIMHVPAAAADVAMFGKVKSRDALIEQLEREAPKAVIFDKPMERRVFFGDD